MIIIRLLKTIFCNNGHSAVSNTNLSLMIICSLSIVGLCLCMYYSDGSYVEDCLPLIILVVIFVPAFLIGHFKLLNHNMEIERSQVDNTQNTRRPEDRPDAESRQDDIDIALDAPLRERKNGGDEQ